MPDDPSSPRPPAHPLLAEQLRALLRIDGLPAAEAARLHAALAPLLAAVDATYHDAEAERALLGRSLQALRASEARFRAVFDHAAVGIAVHDADGVLRQVNPAFARMLGYAPEELLGRRAAELSPPEDAVLTREPVRELKARLRDSVQVEKRFLRRDGRVIWGDLVISRVDDAAAPDAPVAVVGMMQDVTARREMEVELERRAFHDGLTGLANRALFRDRVEHALARSVGTPGRRGGDAARRRVAVLFLDLDGFKHVNDSLGHAAGDRLLMVVATRLVGAVRASDTVARLGGDEFAVLLEDLGDASEATAAAERILRVVGEPIALDAHGREVLVGASIGIAHGRPDEGCDPLLRGADTAMYAAKGAGKGRHATYDPSMHRQAVERVQLEVDLRRAIEQAELALHYQPIVELTTGRLRGAEALLRWEHATRGAVSPARFVAIAEETGLIVPLGWWVLEEACRQTARWRAAGLVNGEFTMSVNVSARQLQGDDVEARVAGALGAAGIPGHTLVLEITESVLMQRTEQVLARLSALKALGVRLAIDDFGTGYSSLSSLKRFPIDTLKIDKTFVDALSATATHEAGDVSLLRTVVALGQSLGLHLVAEGIEEAAQSAALVALGCHEGQGYHYSRPLPPDRFAERLSGAAPRTAAPLARA